MRRARKGIRKAFKRYQTASKKAWEGHHLVKAMLATRMTDARACCYQAERHNSALPNRWISASAIVTHAPSSWRHPNAVL